jgi:hypothetical protein
MSFLSQASPLGGLSPPHDTFQGHAAHAIEWSITLSPKGSLGACTPKVLPHSSMPLSRRTATQEQRLSAVACRPMFGWSASWACGWDAPCLAHPRAPTPLYWITSSAWNRRDGGIVIPSALAVLRLMTSSNLMGRSTGSSDGLVPLRILPTYAAARRYSSTRFGP